MSQQRSPETAAAQAGHYIDPATGGVVPPIQVSTTFARDADYQPIGDYIYSRDANPTYEEVESLMAELEGGAGALAFASGMGAVTTLFETVETGNHIVAPQVMYHGAQDWLRRIARRRGIGLSLFDAADPDALAAAIRAGETTIVWIESPVNPTWDVIDIAAAAEAAHRAGAMLAVDSTVAPPVTTRPLDLGADIVFHSGTKYLNGHTDVVAGLLVTKERDARWRELWDIRRRLGASLGPFEAWLLLRGMRTLFIRFERASQNALQLAEHLEGHPKLEAVLYPGLVSHPGHDIAKRQMTRGFGGMMSLLVEGGAEAAHTVVTGVEVFVPATSLGGVESLIEHRAVVEPAESVVPPNLLRLSVGIESVDDLVADLEQALDLI